MVAKEAVEEENNAHLSWVVTGTFVLSAVVV
jgi:hypothetical protein